MSRKIFMQMAAPVVIALRTDRLDSVPYFIGEEMARDGLSNDDRRHIVLKQLQLSDDALDEVDFHIDADYFSMKLFGHRIDKSDARLRLSPAEGTWAEIGQEDLGSLARFIKVFGKDPVFPILLHSISAESDSDNLHGEELVSEFVELSLEGAKIYQQSSETNNQFWDHSNGPANGEGFMSARLVKGGKRTLTPTSTMKFA